MSWGHPGRHSGFKACLNYIAETMSKKKKKNYTPVPKVSIMVTFQNLASVVSRTITVLGSRIFSWSPPSRRLIDFVFIPPAPLSQADVASRGPSLACGGLLCLEKCVGV